MPQANAHAAIYVSPANEDEWTAYKEKLEALRLQIFDMSLPDDEFMNRSSRRGPFMDKIRRRFSRQEIAGCLGARELFGGTMSFADSPQLDFAGEYSVLGFYEHLLSTWVRPAQAPASPRHAGKDL